MTCEDARESLYAVADNPRYATDEEHQEALEHKAQCGACDDLFQRRREHTNKVVRSHAGGGCCDII